MVWWKHNSNNRSYNNSIICISNRPLQTLPKAAPMLKKVRGREATLAEKDSPHQPVETYKRRRWYESLPYARHRDFERGNSPWETKLPVLRAYRTKASTRLWRSKVNRRLPRLSQTAGPFRHSTLSLLLLFRCIILFLRLIRLSELACNFIL